jgi:hypothetical protein
MTKRNRKTLAEYFSAGRMPTQEAFGDLIDSVVNIVDDGFDKSATDGIKVAQLDNNSKLISFYDEITVNRPLWSMGFSQSGYAAASGKDLSFTYTGTNTTGFTLSYAPLPDPGDNGEEKGKVKVGINNPAPRCELDVKGVIASDGRIGRPGHPARLARADGKWHPVITGLDGCQAFEIMAGVGKKRSGRYALLHAFALSTFNSSNSKITYHQAHYSSRCDQIDLRWTGDTHNYALEMRTRCDFEESRGERIYIRYYVTQLWFDTFMEECTPESDDSGILDETREG